MIAEGRWGDAGRALDEILDQVHAARVVCLGDVMLDRFCYGQVDRVSNEAPIQIMQLQSEASMLGGVGNVGRNVVALGAHAVLIGVVGDDAAAQEIRELAEFEERLEHRLIVDPGRPSTVKTRFVAGGQQLLRADHESIEPIDSVTTKLVLDQLGAALRRCDVLVLSDYTKGVLTDEVLERAIDLAKRASVPVIADPKRHDLSAYAGVTVLKPNRGELSRALRMPCDTDEEVEAAASRVAIDCGIESVLVSRSEHGMSLISPGRPAIHLPARALEVFDVSGAGDTVVATTAVAVAVGAPLPAAAELANLAGGVVVGKLGTAVTSRDELSAALLVAGVSKAEAKVKSALAVHAEVERWRKERQRIAFTHGGFDLLHPGHISLLTQAREHCDRLIVGLYSDSLVARRKGPGRPIQDELARAIVLASMELVDRVIIYGEESPNALLHLLEPDILITGGDHPVDQTPGASVVQAYGGTVKAARRLMDHSSTQLVEQLAGDDDVSL